MKKLLQAMFCIALSLSLNSCFINRTTVGDGPVGKVSAAKYSHAKQLYLFWGLVAVGQAQPPMPQGCGYQVKTAYNVIDAIVTTITAGIFGTRNVKIMVNKGSPCDPAIMKIERKEQKEMQKQEKRDGK
jgi:hypothetical protein